MAIIYTYPVKNSIFDGDSFVITDAQDRNMTKQLGVGVIMAPIYELQEQVAQLEKQIEDLYKRIEDINSQITVIQEEITALQQCCSENAKAIASNTTAIASNTTAQKVLASDIATNETDIASLDTLLNKFISAQSETNASLQAQINACCGSGGAAILGLKPNQAERGETITTIISIENMPGPILDVNLGPGVTVDSFTLEDDGSISVVATVAEDAAIGLNDVSVTYGEKEQATLANAFEIEPSTAGAVITGLEPNKGKKGETISTTISVKNMPGPILSVSFGTGITTNSFIQNPDGSISANITISEEAEIGFNNLIVGYGEKESATLENAFEIIDQLVNCSQNPELEPISTYDAVALPDPENAGFDAWGGELYRFKLGAIPPPPSTAPIVWRFASDAPGSTYPAPPEWMTLTNGDGDNTCTISGTPPKSEIGSEYPMSLEGVRSDCPDKQANYTWGLSVIEKP